MEAEEVINLFDSSWFHQEFFKKSPKKPSSSNIRTIPDRRIGEISPPRLQISSHLTIHTRAKSEEAISPRGFDSPISVLPSPHLQTILSGIEGEAGFQIRVNTDEKKKKKKREKRKKRISKGFSKSLSELEFQELKGFMDLGFVFSEEDKRDSTLVEIIPGLQRLGQEKGENEEDKSSSFVQHHRPYLSEAWEALEREERENPLMNWKVPSVNNETGMKDSLKWWAHTVASTVR